MRNLKKVLSLALALVMLLGMMVVGAGAATSFKDDADIQNKEAVAVLVGLGVMKGREDGSNFEPNATLTRAEAAKMIAQLDLGVEAADALKANGNNTFTDVWTDYWAAGPIDYCVERGYIKGDGNGHFFPNQNVTGVQFASMLLRLLGYDADIEGLVGSQWAVNAASLARKAGLTTKVLANNVDMTRDGMAQMSFNALTAPMVEYKGMNITIGDTTIKNPATIRVHDQDLENGDSTYDGGKPTATTPIRLCEERFPYLKLTNTAEDGFGHTAAVWKYRGAEIKGSETTVTPDYVTNTTVLKGTPDWAKIDDMSIVAPDPSKNVKGTEIYVNGFKGDSTTDFNKFTGKSTTYSGKLSTSGITSNGRLVEVYLNEEDMTEIDKIVVTDTALATVYSVGSDGTIKVKLEKTDLEKKNATAALADKPAYFVQGAVVLTTDEDETTVYADPKVGDVVLVKGYNDTTPVIGKTVNKSVTTLTSVELAEEMKAFVSKKTYSSKDEASYLTVRGDEHEYKDAFNVVADYAVDDFEPNDKNYDSTLYLDEYQNIMKVIMGVDPNATTDKLIAVAEYYETILDGKITGMVKGVLSNGETVNFPLKNRGTVDEGIYTYTLDEGRYTLAELIARTGTDITDASPSTHVANTDLNKTISFKSSDVLGKENARDYLLSDDVKFIFVKDGEISVANGRQTYDYENANVLAQALRKNPNGSGYQVRAVFIMAEPDIADISDIIYVHSTYRNNTVIKDLENGSQVKQYGYNAYDANGDKIEDFVGFNDELAGATGNFYKKDLDQYGAQKGTKGNVVKKHTLLPGANDPTDSIAVTANNLWVTQANGQTGDAFTVSDGIKTAEGGGTTLRFISSASTKVVDLSDCGRNISSVAQLNDAVFDGYSDTQVAVIFNTSGDNNDVLIAKTVFVTKCAKNATYPNGRPTGNPAGGDGTTTEGAHKVDSITTGASEVEFNKVAVGDVPNSKTDADKLEGWGSFVNAEKDEIILIRAKNGSKLTPASSAKIYETGTYTEAGVVVSDINSGTGVLKFTMGEKNLTLTAVETDTPTVAAITIATDGSDWNVNAKLLSGGSVAGEAGKTTDDYAKAVYLVDYLNNDTEGKKLGYTAKLDGLVKKGNGELDVDGLILVGEDGIDIPVAKADIAVADDLAVVKVNTTKTIVAADDAATADVESVLNLAGITVEGAGANVFIIQDKGTTDGLVKLATDSTGLSTKLTGIEALDTNGTKGYFVLTATSVTKAGAGTSASIDTSANAPIVRLIIESNDKATMKNSDVLVKVDATMKIGLKFTNAGTVGASKGITAVISATTGTVDGTWKAAAAVPEFAKGTAFTTDTEALLDFTLTPGATAISAITLTLGEA